MNAARAPESGTAIDGTIKWLITANTTDLILVALALFATVAALRWLVGRSLVEPWQRWRHRKMAENAHEVLIRPPRIVERGDARRLWANLAGLLRRFGWRRLLYGAPHVAMEFRWHDREMIVVLWVPGTVPVEDVAGAVRAAWRGSTTEIRPATTPLPSPPSNASGSPADRSPNEAGAWLKPSMSQWFPVTSTDDKEIDPLRAAIEVGANLQPNEYACIQVLARPASTRQSRQVRDGATGKPISGPNADMVVNVIVKLVLAILDFAVSVLIDILSAFVGGGSSRPAPSRTSNTNAYQRRSPDPVRDRASRQAVEKVAGPQWFIAVQLAVASPSGKEHRPESRVRAMVAAIGVHDPQSVPNRLRSSRLTHPGASLAARRMRRGFAASTAELAALAGLPTDLAVPGLDRARARSVPAPVKVVSGGRNTKVLGHSTVGGRAVALKVADARQHLHVMGSTGTGKSTLLCQQILDDITAGRGVVLIDPKGDLAKDVLARFPSQHVHRLVVIDPDQPDSSAYFNPLRVSNGAQPDVVVDNIVSIFSSIYQPHWGPRMDDVLRVSCLTLMQQPNASLAKVTQLLNDQEFRKTYTRGLTDPAGLSGFWKTYESTPVQLQIQTIAPLQTRLRALMLRPFVRSTIGGSTSSLDMRKVLDGGVLIARLPKGELGEYAPRLLASLLLASVWQAALARADVPEQSRADATCYVDEAHGVLNLTGTVGEMLAEARGYRLSFVLAHQNLDQVPKEMQKGLSANARNKVFFNMSPEDAHQLARHTEPELDEGDLNHLGAYVAAARLMVDAEETPAFTVRTRPPTEAGSGGIGMAALRAALAAKAPPRRAPEAIDPSLEDYYTDVDELEAGFGAEGDSDPGQSAGWGRTVPGQPPGYSDPDDDRPDEENPQVRRRS